MYKLQLKSKWTHHEGDMRKLTGKDVDAEDQETEEELLEGVIEIVSDKDPRVQHCKKVFEQIESYLEEKGVDFDLGRVRATPQGLPTAHNRRRSAINPQFLFLRDVPDKLYDEVISPGLDNLFEKLDITVHPWDGPPTSPGYKLQLELRARIPHEVRT